MKAAFYNGNGTMIVKDYPDLTPGPGEALIKVRSTGICGSDLNMNLDKSGPDSDPAGHEVAGEIVSVGDGVEEKHIGSRVAVEVLGSGRACQNCWYCRQGQYIHCPNRSSGMSGGFAEYITRKIEGCYLLSDHMTWDEGALVEPLAVSIHGVRIGKMAGGETVSILGSGTIGLTAVAAAKALGAGKIFATARHPQQKKAALALGADAVSITTENNFEEMVLDATNGRGADLTIETVGGSKGDTLTQAIQVTRRQGRIVILGVFYGQHEIDWTGPVLKEQTIQGSICYGIIDGRHDFESAVEILSDDDCNLSQIVTHRYSLDEIDAGFKTAYDKSSGSIKVQIHQS
ncbi:MAG: Zn-dependent alcohol dehydrogenase [SAR202 cluster bacterium]|nr:MAG: Zn-dependent alcohol dehydrogenase [SAR202 cluster bacterium]MAR86343.1 Zn-dependent alcohol dehydrogenase [Chloroflexota bacterium]